MSMPELPATFESRTKRSVETAFVRLQLFAFISILFLGNCCLGFAQTPKIWPVQVQFQDSTGHEIIPLVGVPFLLVVSYDYNNPTTATYRIRWDWGGTTNYTWTINWGAGDGPGSYYWYLDIWSSFSQAGTLPFTVTVDCDNSIVGAPLDVKSMTFPLTVMPRLNSWDFSGWQSFFASSVTNDGAGGYAYVGMENGQTIVEGAGGYARSPWEVISPAVPMTTTKPMLLASVSKLLTRVGLARLWDQTQGTTNAFDYSRPAAPFLRSLVPFIDPSFDAMTIQELHDHTSGLTNDITDLPSMQSVLAQRVPFTPGSNYYYLNGNYYLLATIMSQIAKQSYSDYMRSNVFIPLGMLQTDDQAVETNTTLIYTSGAVHYPGALYEVSGTQNAGAAGWWSTAEDLAKLMHSLRYCTLVSPAKSASEGFNQGGWAVDGGWSWYWNGAQGHLSTVVSRYSATLDGVVLINSDKGPAGTLLNEAFQLPQRGLTCIATRQQANLVSSFLAYAGYSYTLQSKTNLSSTNWIDGPTISGSNVVCSFKLPITGAAQFTRVRRN